MPNELGNREAAAGLDLSPEVMARFSGAIGERYEIRDEVGHGATAFVYRALDRKHGRLVALKVLRPEVAGSIGAERFLREIRTTSQLSHPHVLTLHDSGVAAGLLYFVMPLIEGESLRARLQRERQLPVDVALRITRDVAEALQYAHGHGVVHRDVKPENILLTSSGGASVGDFGLAHLMQESTERQLTGSGLAVGTAAYMSPEQAVGDAVDSRTDQYALACVLYEMLAGVAPFTAPTAQATLARHRADPVPRVRQIRGSVPEPIEHAVVKALSKYAADRFTSVAEFAKAAEDGNSGGSRRALVRTRVRRSVWIGVAAVVLAGAWKISDIVRGPGSRGASSARRATTAKVAVLPFEPLGGDTANAYLADGMAVDLTSALTAIPGIHVVPHSSAFAVRGQTARDAGVSLHADAIIEGTVGHAAPKRMHVTASLVRVDQNTVVWSRTYDEDEKDIFALYDSITTAIARALQVGLPPEAHARLANPPTRSLEAHDFVQRGTYLLEQPDENSRRQALALFSSAIALDSSYASAWNGLARAWYSLADFIMSPREAVPHMLAALDRAIALDSLSADAHALRGHALFFYARRFTDAESSFRRALALDSANSFASGGYAHLLMLFGRNDTAIAVVRRGLRHDPNRRGLLRTAENIYTRTGPPDSAAAQCARLKVLFPDGAGCEQRRLESLGRHQAALSLARKWMPARATGEDYALLARSEALASDTAAARRDLARALHYYRIHYVNEVFLAEAYLALGERDAAIAWLRRGLASDASDIVSIGVEPAFAPLRSDRRFRDLLKRVGLPPPS